jgi:hypothetical protein
LPTEAEWEYACRAGTTTATAFGESLSARQANFDGNYPYGGGFKWFYRERTQAVGYFPANGWGLVDLHGNVLEWCQDWYTNRLDWDTNQVVGAVVADPQGPPAGTERVVRGGAWRSRGEDCRSAWRTGTSRWNANYALGFRVAVGPVGGYGQGVIAGSVVWQGGEEPLPEVAMGLYDLENPPVGNQPAAWLATTRTGLDGSYAFTNLPPGLYGVWPLETAEAGGLRFQWETNSASPKVALVAGTNTVNFTAVDASIFEGDEGKLTVTIYADLSGYGTGCDLAISRRSFNWFGANSWYDSLPTDSVVWDFTNTVRGLASIKVTVVYGYNWGFGGLENVFKVNLTPKGGAVGASAQIDLPIAGCPPASVFAWDPKSQGRGLWRSAGLAVPVALPATKVEFPGRFKASWQAVAGAYGYAVEVSTDGSFIENKGRPTVSWDVGAATQCDVIVPQAVENKLPYYYRVIACGDNVLSTYSATVRVGLDALAAPVALPAAKVEFPGRFVAQWQALAGAEGYGVEVSTDGSFAENNGQPDLAIDSGSATQWAFELPAATVNKLPYYYRVKAWASNVGSQYSTVVKVGLDAVAAPVALPASGVGTNGFTASWAPLGGALGYRLDVSADPQFGSFILGDADVGTNHNYVIPIPIQAGSTIYYRVRAWAKGCTSVDSKTIPVELVPEASAATGLGINCFTAAWQRLPGAQDYRLDISTDADFKNIFMADVAIGNATSYAVQNLPGNGDWFYRVRAIVAGFVSGNSKPIQVALGAVGPVALPATDENRLLEFTANWAPLAGAKRYRIDAWVLKNGTKYDILNDKDVGNVTKFTVPSGSYNVRYRVRATAGTLVSAYSNTIIARKY